MFEVGPRWLVVWYFLQEALSCSFASDLQVYQSPYLTSRKRFEVKKEIGFKRISTLHKEWVFTGFYNLKTFVETFHLSSLNRLLLGYPVAEHLANDLKDAGTLRQPLGSIPSWASVFSSTFIFVGDCHLASLELGIEFDVCGRVGWNILASPFGEALLFNLIPFFETGLLDVSVQAQDLLRFFPVGTQLQTQQPWCSWSQFGSLKLRVSVSIHALLTASYTQRRNAQEIPYVQYSLSGGLRYDLNCSIAVCFAEPDGYSVPTEDSRCFLLGAVGDWNAMSGSRSLRYHKKDIDVAWWFITAGNGLGWGFHIRNGRSPHRIYVSFSTRKGKDLHGVLCTVIEPLWWLKTCS